MCYGVGWQGAVEGKEDGGVVSYIVWKGRTSLPITCVSAGHKEVQVRAGYLGMCF